MFLQDLMYKSLMKLSHIVSHPSTVLTNKINRSELRSSSLQYVPELDHVGDQLLCVEVSEVKLDLIKDVVKEVASAASFVNFLPLANKVSIELQGRRQILVQVSVTVFRFCCRFGLRWFQPLMLKRW